MPVAADIRLGLVGAGRWGKNYITSIASVPGARLVAVASRNPITAALVPAGCRIVGEWRRIVEAADIDGIVVASPPATHVEILGAAIQAGKPVMIEKPTVVSAEQAQSVRQLLVDRSATIVVDHVHLYDQAFRLLRERVTTLGPIRGILSSAGNFGPYRKDVSILWDWAPHDIAMCLAVCPGPIRPISARKLRSCWVDGALAETIALELDGGGADVQIHLSTLEPKHRWFAVRLEDRTLVYRDAGARTLVQLGPNEDIRAAGHTLFTSPEPPLTRAIIEFTEAVRAGDRTRESIELGLSTVDLICEFEKMSAASQNSN